MNFFAPASTPGNPFRGCLVPLLLLALLVGPGSLLTACGGLDPDLARSQLPHWRPGDYWQGAKIGHRTIRDRNGNVREVARIERDCELVGDIGQAGVCVDRIDYGYATPDTTRRLEWSVHYADDLHATVKYADEAGALEGKTIGAYLVLEGEYALPATAPEAGETGSVEIRLHLRPGAGRPVLQTEQYSWLGIDLGQAETLWLDAGD